MTARIGSIGAPRTARPAIWTRLAAAIGSWHLDRELAEGADPRTRPALALRARSLIARRHRIAVRVDMVVERASEPPRRGLQVPLRHQAIAEARDDLHRLSAELRGDDECRAEGVARAHLLLVDGGSPLYYGGGRTPLFIRSAAGRGLPDDLLAATRAAYRALRLATPY